MIKSVSLIEVFTNHSEVFDKTAIFIYVMTAAKKIEARPEIYSYHDYREYLRAAFDFIKKSKKKSMREVAKNMGIAVSNLSMILSKQRNLHELLAKRLAKELSMSASEESYLQQLMVIADSDDFNARNEALKNLQNFSNYKKSYSKEIEVYKYLSCWYFIAIREMSALPDFQLNADYIRERLRYRVTPTEVEEAIQFLLEFNFLAVDKEGKVTRPEINLECFSGVYRISLGEYYRQMFAIAHEAFESVPRAERNYYSHTVAIPQSQVQDFLDIIKDSFDRIVSKSDSVEASKETRELVYHFGLQAFPLSKKITSEDTE